MQQAGVGSTHEAFLAGLRAFIGEGWTGDVVVALVAIAAMSALSFTLALLALRGRISRG